MADPTTTLRVTALLDALARDGHIADRQALETFVLARQGETELPLHVRVLVGIAAVIACACFMGFLWKIGLIDYDEPAGMLVSGPVFIVAAILMIRMAGTAQTALGSFLRQASLATMVTGKLLFVSGFAESFDTGWAVPLATLMVTVATYSLFAMSIDRFLSSFFVLLSVTVNLVWNDELELPRELLTSGYFGLQLAVAGVLLTHGRVRREYLPIAYALILSLCATALVPWYNATDPMLVNAFLAGGLIALFAWAGGGIDTLKRPPMVLASLGAVLLALISTPALMLSISLMIVGYAKHDRRLLILGALLMPVFLWTYYYDPDVSLLMKSVILTVSGITLLAGRFYLSYTGKSREA